MRTLVALLVLCAAASAATVTGKAVDPNGNPYTGTVSAYLFSSSTPIAGGKIVNPSLGPLPLAADGSFTISVTGTDTIAPPGSVWQFTFCGPSIPNPPYNTSQTICFDAPAVSVTGTSLDITATVANSAKVLGPPTDATIRAANNTFTGINSFKSLNGTPFADQFGLSDIGADVNSSDTGCTANLDVVCPISVSPQPGTAPNFTTPILLNTSSRVHLLDFSGDYLNYTPTTATTALTPDWIPAGGSGYITAHGIRNLTLRNNGCVTNGGCGSLATGISFGGTNSGMQNGYTFGLRVQGFGTGLSYVTSGSTSWGNDHFHCAVTHNTTGVNVPVVGLEATNFFGCKFAVNGTAISNGNTADIYDFGGSMDSNTVAGYSGFGDYYAFGKHFENLGVTTLNYLNITSGVSALFGGLFLDDQPSGTVSSMFTTSGGLLHVSGIHVFSGGRMVTNLFNVSGGGHVNGDYATTSPALITSPCANTTLCTLQINSSTGTTEWGDRTFLGDQSFQAGTGTVLGPLHFKNAAGTNLWDIGNKDSGGASTDDFVIASTSGTGLGQNMVARVLSSTGFWTNFRFDTAGTNNVFKVNGVPISNGVTALPGTLTTTAATTDNVAITGVTSSSHCSLTPTNASAATNIATTFISAKTTNQITVTHTATASMTYDVLCTQN